MDAECDGPRAVGEVLVFGACRDSPVRENFYFRKIGAFGDDGECRLLVVCDEKTAAGALLAQEVSHFPERDDARDLAVKLLHRLEVVYLDFDKEEPLGGVLALRYGFQVRREFVRVVEPGRYVYGDVLVALEQVEEQGDDDECRGRDGHVVELRL